MELFIINDKNLNSFVQKKNQTIASRLKTNYYKQVYLELKSKNISSYQFNFFVKLKI